MSTTSAALNGSMQRFLIYRFESSLTDCPVMAKGIQPSGDSEADDTFTFIAAHYESVFRED